MPDEMDPAEALETLLKQREQAKKSVYNMAMAKEKAEQERDELKSALFKAGEERVEMLGEAVKTGEYIAGLQDKEVARSQIIDALTERADAAEKRVTILETILGRIESELYTAILEEDEFVPSEEVEKDLAEKHDEALYGTAAVPLESSTTRPGPAMPMRDRWVGWMWGRVHRSEMKKLERGARFDSIKAAIFSKSMALATLIAAPFIAMSVFNALATQGIYVDFVRTLWEQTTWLSDSLKNSLVAWSPVIAVQPFLVLFLFRWAFPRVSYATTGPEPSGAAERESDEHAQVRETTPEPLRTPAAKPAAPETEDDKDAYEKVLGELFGEDDTDA